MKFLTLTLLALPTVLAADCGPWRGNPSRDFMAGAWNLRSRLCNCINFGGSNSECKMEVSDIRLEILNAKPSVQLCWDATENILTQCVQNGRWWSMVDGMV